MLAGRDRDGGPVHGVLFRGRRYDTGDRADYLRTVVRLAVDRDDLGPELLVWLTNFVKQQDARCRVSLERMRTVDEHLAAVLGPLGPLPPLEVTLLDAHGCVLAEDVVAPRPLPGFDNSSMDGYAVRSADVGGATPQTPVVLPVVGDIAAGSGGVPTA